MSVLAHSRVLMLEQAFAHIANTRMRDVPVQNLALRVQAVGFAAQAHDTALLGVLVTPWFMNLVRLPLAQASILAVGEKAKRQVGTEQFEFIGAHEAGLGAFEACSLFSPMFDFADHAAALATASEVLALLRAPVPQVPQVSQVHRPPPVPSRRGFLLGRSLESARL
ncbi:MAG: hupJ [Comamonadaceae bacterium]|nr:MAG: hupJ [Comamonadaceae bacterium]